MSDLGEPIWNVRWRENDGIALRVIVALCAGVFAMYAWSSLIAHKNEWSVEALPAAVVLGAAAYILFAPDQNRHVLGTRGFEVSLVRHGVFTRKHVVRFADVDDIETIFTRVVTDAQSQIYTRTRATYRFLDRAGQETFVLVGEFVEPQQRALGWSPTEPVDLSLVDRLPGTSPVRLGFDAHKAWEASKQAPRDGVYR